MGTDLILFNGQFGSAASVAGISRAAPVLCENALMGIGSQHAENLFSCAGFSNALSTPEGVAFRDRYRRSFGGTAPVPNRFGVSCYEGLHLLATLVQRAHSLNVYKLQAYSDGARVSTPRGECWMRANHLGAPVHITKASGSNLSVVQTIGCRDATSEHAWLSWREPAGSALAGQKTSFLAGVFI
ncbi:MULTISPECIES: ABC transporter substrate-binding protein [unclassified Bradyrhizobium]|uniref:ABC transporter substrate-binding protein n=1 Tax=unclassified Bradyrhizobium TaxID=2631580 RepID=UPI00339B3484